MAELQLLQERPDLTPGESSAVLRQSVWKQGLFNMKEWNIWFLLKNWDSVLLFGLANYQPSLFLPWWK